MVISRETKAKVQHYKLKLFSRKRKLTSLQLPYTHVRDHGLMIQNDTHVREQRLCTVVFQSHEWTYKANTLLTWEHKGRQIQ